MADLKPTHFPGVEKVLGAPPGWNEEAHGPCAGLPVMVRDGVCVSCWTPTFRDRLKVLFGGKVWLHVASGQTQPPVALGIGWLED